MTLHSKCCGNCGAQMFWNRFFSRWECKLCGNVEHRTEIDEFNIFPRMN